MLAPKLLLPGRHVSTGPPSRPTNNQQLWLTWSSSRWCWNHPINPRGTVETGPVQLQQLEEEEVEKTRRDAWMLSEVLLLRPDADVCLNMNSLCIQETAATLTTF